MFDVSKSLGLELVGTADHYSVIRALVRYGYDWESVAPQLICYRLAFAIKRAFELVQQNHSEEGTNFELELGAEEESEIEEDPSVDEEESEIEEDPSVDEEANIEEILIAMEELHSKINCNSKEFDPNEESHSEKPLTYYKAILKRLPQNLIDWVKFLYDQGFIIDNGVGGALGFTQLMYLVACVGYDTEQRSLLTRTVLALCLLKADVSIREPRYGRQVLHLLICQKRSLITSSQFEDLAYILIHCGGADVCATTYEGLDPTELAYYNGRLETWINVLDRCEIDIRGVLSECLQRKRRARYADHGDSTAVDFEDIPLVTSETVRRRKTIVGDRLVE